MSKTKERLLQFLHYKDLGQKKFELSIDMGNGWVNKVGDSIRENTLQKIRDVYPELNIAWLISGVGEMLNPGCSTGQSEDTVYNLIKEVCFKLGIKGKDLAEMLEVSPSYISDIKNGNRKPSDDFVEKLSALIPKMDVGTEAREVCGSGNTANLVPLLPIAAQGGSLDDFIVSVKGSDCEFVISPIKGAEFAIPVCGDSMAPEYPNGSQILIKKINESAFVEWGKVYVLDTCNGTVIKILVPSDKEGCVRCISINKNPIYAPFDVDWSDVYGVYRVLMCMSVK